LPGDPRGPVLALGDSILCGPEEGAFGVPPRVWPQWLAETLDLPFHRLARPGALSGDVERLFVGRLRSDYALACVGVGTNDVRMLDWDPRSFAASLTRLLGVAAERAQRVCVATVPADLGRPRAGAKVGGLNTIVRECAASSGATVVELHDFGGWRWWFPDAVHPTALGQLEIARRAAVALELDVSPLGLADVQSGRTADLRYAATRQVAHLARDWRRRAAERNV
jgi:lysophospholipase L1-like esterase